MITVAVRKHPVFERDGIHLRVDVPVTFVEATLGATIEVPTLDGAPVKLKVPAGTPSGRVLRVKGRGVTTAKGTGDLLATVVVAVPRHVPGDAEAHLEAFAAAMPPENPRAELLETGEGAIAPWTSEARSSPSPWRRSWPACTRRRCGSTTDSAW